MGRFDRQIPVFGEEGQRRISESAVAVFGCGGLGCNTITQLALAGIGHLIINDFDTVSESNLNRQFVYSGRSGSKAALMGEWIRKVSPETEVTVFEGRSDRDSMYGIIGDADIAVDCLDSNDSRLELNSAVLERGIPLVHGGVEGFYGQVTVVVPGETPCLGCFLPPGRRTVPSVGACVSVIGSLQAAEVLKMITGTGEPLKGRMLVMDMSEGSSETVGIRRRPDCPHCH